MLLVPPNAFFSCGASESHAAPPAASGCYAAIDVFLAVQLLRLRHSWRAWAMLRAGIGLIGGAVLVVISVISSARPVADALLWLATVTYCAALLLLLYGSPSTKRVWAGRFAFAGAVVILAGGIVVAITGVALDLATRPRTNAVIRDILPDLQRWADVKSGFSSVDLMAWDIQARGPERLTVQTALLWAHTEVPGSAGVYALVQAQRDPVGDDRWHRDRYKEFRTAPSAVEICSFLDALSVEGSGVQVLSREFDADAWTRRTGERPPCGRLP